jgi:hypothetical protein
MLHLASFQNRLVSVGPGSFWTQFDYPGQDGSVGGASSSRSLILADD